MKKFANIVKLTDKLYDLAKFLLEEGKISIFQKNFDKETSREKKYAYTIDFLHDRY